MSKLLWIFSLGLCSWISFCQAHIVISCRFRGVFHVEKDGRYHLTFEDAKKACDELDAIIATKEQVETAQQADFETCRYGWVDNSTVVIPRTTQNPICAANYIGVYVLYSNVTTPYDVYCYNMTETSEKNCEQYDYRNKSVPSYDPTEEGAFTDSGSSNVRPTHYELDISSANTQEVIPLEDGTTEPMMSTEQPDHSGDHTEVGDTNGPYLIPGDYDITPNQEDPMKVHPTDEGTSHPEHDLLPATDPSVHQDPGTMHDESHKHDQNKEEERGSDDLDVKTPSGSAEGSSDSNQAKHRRSAAIPEWLIVCVSLVCLGLIFSVCIALNARRICGQKKKLVINGNKGCPEDGGIMEQNGDTIKSQEMVQLVSRDQSNELGDMTHEDIRNAKEVDMKIGV